MYLQTLRQIILSFSEIICLSLLFEVKKMDAIKTYFWIFKFNLSLQKLKSQPIRIIRDCTFTHYRKNILSGLNCFQRLSADDTCTHDCGHKLDAEKKMFTLFSSSDPTAHECSLAMMPTAIQ